MSGDEAARSTLDAPGRARGRDRLSPGTRNRILACVAAGAMAVAVFVFYVGVYRARGYRLPIGFDASWYIWRAEYVGTNGVGPLGTAERPGSALLAAVLQGTTGIAQLRMAVVLPLCLVAVFALAAGALARAGLGRGHLRWWVSIAVAGTFLGVTRLVGENVATLIAVTLVAAALVVLVCRMAGGAGSGLWGPIMLLAAAGLAHWLFLAVFLVTLGVAAVLALPSSLRARAGGMPLLRTESGSLAAAGGAAAALVLAVVAGILRAPFDTIQAREDPSRYGQKLMTDVRRLYLPWTAPVAALGAASLALSERGRRSPTRSMTLRLLAAWSIVALAGVAFGVITEVLPPHRFLELFLAVPVALALAHAVVVAAKWVGARTARPVGWLVAAAGVILLAIPGAGAWYRHGPGEWIQASSLLQAETAGEYMRTLAPGTPVVFLVSPSGPAGVLSAPLKERAIRLGLSPDLQEDMYLFVGRSADLLAGRRSTTGNQAANEAALPYWDALVPVLSGSPPILILRALAPRQYQQAVAAGAGLAGPGVAVLRGPVPESPLTPPDLSQPVSPLRTALSGGVLLLGLLFVAGAGWTVLCLGPDADPWVGAALVPAVGTAVLMLGGLVAAKMGVPLGGNGGAATYAVTTLTGIALAWFAWGRTATRAASGQVSAPGSG